MLGQTHWVQSVYGHAARYIPQEEKAKGEKSTMQYAADKINELLNKAVADGKITREQAEKAKTLDKDVQKFLMLKAVKDAAKIVHKTTATDWSTIAVVAAIGIGLYMFMKK